ncbi:MAG: hypothetical protein ABII00_02520, partial [Elusimicrobiota bacterium]
ADPPAKDRKRMEKALAQADRRHRFVRASRGEHNIYLASDILRREDAALSRIGEQLKAELEDLSSQPLLSGTYCATLCHPKVGVKVPAKTVRTGGKLMPHKTHAEMMGCVRCHEIGAHKKVFLRKGVRQEVCAPCHGE